MRQRLLWKLLIGHIVPIFAIFTTVVWQAVDQQAALYYKELGESFHVTPFDLHNRFLEAIHHHMFWGVIVALTFTLLFTYLLTSWVLRPLLQITAITKKVADGNYSERVNAISRYEGGQLADAFNHMADNLEMVERLRKNMVADISHELRTPLTNLRGYLEGLSDSVIPPTRETFHMLEQEVLRLVNLVEDLQQLARADAAKVFLDCRQLSLHELLRQIMDLYRPNFQEKELDVQWHLDPDSELVTADRDKLLQAIRNLVDNAWKYTPQWGNVTISAIRTEEGVKTVFTNSGTVVADKDIPYLFERFFRTDRSRSRDVGGAGIGLAIVKELIEAHGGTVGADSGENCTRVWFFLPKTDER